MVKIRLQRRGRKKAPVYKIVAADARSPRDGRYIEALGQYAPLSKPARIEINSERALYWLTVGAQPSNTAKSLLSEAGLMLHLHLLRKGKSEEEIKAELEKWGKEKEVRRLNVVSKKERRAIRLAAEEEKAKAEAESQAKAEAESKTQTETQIQDSTPTAADETSEQPDSSPAAEATES